MNEPKKTAKRLIRPVKCHFCNQPMFYADDERYEPEVMVTVERIRDEPRSFCFYAHVRCWNERMAQSAERTAVEGVGK